MLLQNKITKEFAVILPENCKGTNVTSFNYDVRTWIARKDLEPVNVPALTIHDTIKK